MGAGDVAKRHVNAYVNCMFTVTARGKQRGRRLLSSAESAGNPFDFEGDAEWN